MTVCLRREEASTGSGLGFVKFGMPDYFYNVRTYLCYAYVAIGRRFLTDSLDGTQSGAKDGVRPERLAFYIPLMITVGCILSSR